MHKSRVEFSMQECWSGPSGGERHKIIIKYFNNIHKNSFLTTIVSLSLLKKSHILLLKGVPKNAQYSVTKILELTFWFNEIHHILRVLVGRGCSHKFQTPWPVIRYESKTYA
jgi:hypothetical protein